MPRGTHDIACATILRCSAACQCLDAGRSLDSIKKTKYTYIGNHNAGNRPDVGSSGCLECCRSARNCSTTALACSQAMTTAISGFLTKVPALLRIVNRPREGGNSRACLQTPAAGLYCSPRARAEAGGRHMGRGDWTDPQWQPLEPLLSAQKPRTGRSSQDHRTIINGILWVRRPGGTCRSGSAPARHPLHHPPQKERTAPGAL